MNWGRRDTIQHTSAPSTSRNLSQPVAFPNLQLENASHTIFRGLQNWTVLNNIQALGATETRVGSLPGLGLLVPLVLHSIFSQALLWSSP